MKRNVLIFAFLVSFCFTAVAQTKVNSGKNFVVYSYDNWETASSDYLKMCEEYNIILYSINDDCDFTKQSYYTVKQGEWNFIIINGVNSKGTWSSFCISSPEGRQTELFGKGNDNIGFDDFYKKEATDKLNKMKLRYTFLGEPIP